MKTHEPAQDSYIFYTTQIKQSLGRPLTKKECSRIMQAYITSIPWQDVAKELEGK